MMDRQLSRDFRLSEFPGWERATPAQVRELERTVSRVLQPLRSAMGVPVTPSSWMYWSDGTPRTGSHGQSGGTVDFVVSHGLTRDAWEWGKTYLLPSGYVGRWIYEPARSSEEGRRQGEHIHMATRADMERLAELEGRPELATIQALEEEEEGRYRLAFEIIPPALGLGGILAGFAALYYFLARRGSPVAV